VSLPPGYAQSSSIPLSLWVLARPGDATDPHHVLLLDASVQAEDVEPSEIGAAVRGWLDHIQVPKSLAARAVPRMDLIAADSSVLPGRWVGSAPAEDPALVATRLRERVESLNRCQRDLQALPAASQLLEPALPELRRVTVDELLREGLVSLHKGVRVERDLLTDEGLPVVTPRDVRHPQAEPMRHVDPADLMREPDLTQPGDVLVVTEGSHVATWVDREGGHVAAAPVQRLRVTPSSWLRPDHLAACLASTWNSRFLVGSTIPRAPIGELQVLVAPPAQQDALTAYLARLADVAGHAERVIAAATGLADETLDAAMSGALAVAEEHEPWR
jgi:hypothetical protein